MKKVDNAAVIFLAVFAIYFCSYLALAASVPAAGRFKYVNTGDFGELSVEYFADYRVTPLQTFPFAVCFYNTTPNAYTLGIRMGDKRSESLMRWVWGASLGKPVKENASLTFGKDGNLVLAEADGKVVWQTNTANENVVGLSLLGTGNLVLYDKSGKFVWQSFDYPTDSILVGQTLRSSGVGRIVGRVSAKNGSPGPYSHGIDGRFLTMKDQIKNSKQFLYYYKSFEFGNNQGSLGNMTFEAEPENDQNHAYELRFAFDMNNSTSSGTYILARPKYNATYSFLRVDFDGNLRIYTLDPLVDWGAWEKTFVLFNREDVINSVTECNLPTRCGALGVCADNQCVACPTAKGLQGWSEECLPPVLPPCKGGGNVDYYKVVGVEHFSSQYNDGIGSIKLADCKAKCDADCKCLGYFYKAESSKCLLVPELGTFVKVSNSSHVGFIKKAK